VLQRAIAELRDVLPRETHIVVAAMRPRVCRLGGAIADGVLLNWMLPEQLLDARRWVQEGADEAGRAAPLVCSYVRVALASGSRERLRAEERRYRSIDEGQRKHFTAMSVPLGSVGVAASTPQEVREGLAVYQSTHDLPIVRVLAASDSTSLTAVADAAAPLAPCIPRPVARDGHRDWALPGSAGHGPPGHPQEVGAAGRLAL
jgi:alkanesulfonate monooxygenase SsuD/methylene tetrahydromethanopterin reductase-like flavin-dependent oxidoreductase (luciferase family)